MFFCKGENVRLPSDEEKVVLSKLRTIFLGTEKVDIPSLKAVDKWLVFKEISLVNGLLPNLLHLCVDATSLNRLIYAGSYVVCERLGVLGKKNKCLKSKKPWWQRRLEGKIKEWRKDLGRISEMVKGTKMKDKVLRELKNRYQVSERGTRSVTVFLENKVQAASTKIKYFVEANQTKRQNTLFKNNQSQLYKEF